MAASFAEVVTPDDEFRAVVRKYKTKERGRAKIRVWLRVGAVTRT